MRSSRAKRLFYWMYFLSLKLRRRERGRSRISSLHSIFPRTHTCHRFPYSFYLRNPGLRTVRLLVVVLCVCGRGGGGSMPFTFCSIIYAFGFMNSLCRSRSNLVWFRRSWNKVCSCHFLETMASSSSSSSSTTSSSTTQQQRRQKRVPMRMGDFSVMDQEFDSVRERFDQEMRRMEDEMNKFRSDHIHSRQLSSLGLLLEWNNEIIHLMLPAALPPRIFAVA